MDDLTISSWAAAIAAAIGLAGWIAALTPTEADDRIVGRVRNLWRRLRGGGPLPTFLLATVVGGCATLGLWSPLGIPDLRTPEGRAWIRDTARYLASAEGAADLSARIKAARILGVDVIDLSSDEAKDVAARCAALALLLRSGEATGDEISADASAACARITEALAEDREGA